MFELFELFELRGYVDYSVSQYGKKYHFVGTTYLDGTQCDWGGGVVRILSHVGTPIGWHDDAHAGWGRWGRGGMMGSCWAPCDVPDSWTLWSKYLDMRKRSGVGCLLRIVPKVLSK